jgi:hypothetical protein
MGVREGYGCVGEGHQEVSLPTLRAGACVFRDFSPCACCTYVHHGEPLPVGVDKEDDVTGTEPQGGRGLPSASQRWALHTAPIHTKGGTPRRHPVQLHEGTVVMEGGRGGGQEAAGGEGCR